MLCGGVALAERRSRWYAVDMERVRVITGLAMAIVALAIGLASVALAVLTDEPLPIPFAGVGLVFLAAGLSKHPTDTASRQH